MLRSRFLHDDWEFACRGWKLPTGKLGCSVHEWRSARVPGHVHSDLIRHGIIADPHEELHELGCQWVDEEDWSYRSTFEVMLDAELPRRKLKFEGLDTVCEVKLNGVVVATHDNMFLPLEVDVSNELCEGRNELHIDFRSAVREARERRYAYFKRFEIPESVRNFDERAFLRKAQYMFGWDWGPRLVSAGIWRPVSFIEYKSRIVDVQVRQEHMGDGSVKLAILSQVDGDGEVLHYLEGWEDPVHDGEVVRISQPRLWSPAGFGEQHLYSVTTVLIDEVERNPEVSPFVLDRRTTRFGLRRVQLLQVPDEFGESFEFEVNGKRIWAVGANWIPDHSMPGLVDNLRLKQRLTGARDLNMNMLRVWGGGYYESDEFYAQCNELGLLVWQDFPYACSYYPDDELTLGLVREEAEANVIRLRNHPSLVIWCGNNENSTMFESKWGGADNQPCRYFGTTIYDDVLPDVLEKLDRTRPYVPSSPWGGSYSNSGGTGDQHTWDVWHGRGDWKHYADSTARFSSEFGFASAPTLNAWQKMMPRVSDPGRVALGHPIARWHDKTAKGFDAFLQFVELHYPHSDDIEQWTYYSQLNQRDALRFGIEHFRRSQFCKGALVWQLNDCWPVQSWALIDSTGAYKAAAYEMRRLYAPELASLEHLEDTLRLWAILDNSEVAFGGVAQMEARCLSNGSLLEKWECQVELVSGTRRVVIDADVSQFDRITTIITASLGTSSTFRLMAEPRDMVLRSAHIVAHWANDILEIACEGPVVDLFLWDPDCKLVLRDNFITLPAGGTARLRTRGTPVHISARSLAGLHSVDLHSSQVLSRDSLGPFTR